MLPIRPKLLYRIASLTFVIFAVGHTVGFMRFRPPTPESQAVLSAMENVHFAIGGGTYSLGGFYVGFGLYATAYLLFSAFLAWQLGNVAPAYPRAISSIAWGFFVVQLVSVALSWIYFLPPPVLLSVIVAACLGWAAWRGQSA